MCRSRVRQLVLMLVPLVLPAGCGSPEFVLAPVYGRVTVDGEPVLGLRVSFEPVGGSGRPLPGPDSNAITDADGKYVVYTSDSRRRGAVVGPCRVRIWALPSNVPDRMIFDDRDPHYDPVAEIKAIKTQMRGATKSVKRPTGLIPLRYNDKTELTFDVPAAGSDKADFAISWK